MLGFYEFTVSHVLKYKKVPCESLEVRRKMLWAGDICFEKVDPLALTLSKIFFNPIVCQNFIMRHFQSDFQCLCFSNTCHIFTGIFETSTQ